jgi:acyl carrier protein
MSETREQVIGIISDVLELGEADIANLRRDSGYEAMKAWDSLRHVQIIVAIEDAFEIEIDENSIAKMSDVAKIVAYVESAKSSTVS